MSKLRGYRVMLGLTQQQMAGQAGNFFAILQQ